MAVVTMLAGCGGQVASHQSSSGAYPASGIVLLGMGDGAVRSSATVGGDPVAVAVSEDGRTAFLADSAPGDVYAVRLPGLSIAWRQHVGAEPFGLLLHRGRLLVSLFDGAAVVELDPASGALLASHAVPAGPAVLTLDAAGGVVVACHSGGVGRLGAEALAGGEGYGVALAGGMLWTADYSRSALIPAGGESSVQVPLDVFPFWLAPGAGASLLVAAEGASEDTDPGAVFSYAPVTGTFTTLARPRDPDQVLQSGATVFVAAHGDRRVLAIRGGATAAWAPGAAAVAMADDPALGLLVVAVNSHE